MAMDGLGILGTVGFFVPAAVLIALVVGAVVRDRRLSAQEAAEEAQREARRPDSDQLPLVLVMVLFTVGGLGLPFGF
jgi:heme exporter protein D